jgi:hypothetical protein
MGDYKHEGARPYGRAPSHLCVVYSALTLTFVVAEAFDS